MIYDNDLREVLYMSNHENKDKCRHPERLGDKKPGQCSPQQVRICHGHEKHHPCEEKK